VPDIRVPERHKPALLSIHSLSDDDFAALVENLHGANQGGPLPISELTLRVTESVPRITAQEARAVLQALLSIEAARVIHGLSHAGFANNIAISAALDLSPEDSAVLATRIESLAQVPVIAITAKAHDVAAEHERSFHTARMLTDIRPVFGDNASEPPLGAVVTHVLRVTAYHNGRFEDYHVALDNHDLVELEKVVRRALDKNQSLNRTLDALGFSRFQIEDEE
jgi:hypothetical protein